MFKKRLLTIHLLHQIAGSMIVRFFLPDYNEKEESIGNIWFVIDTSGSISDDAIKAAYSEICSAIDQFNGKLSGILSFTESYVTDPVPFSSVDELMSIKPVGGGGNDFSDIFRYMKIIC